MIALQASRAATSSPFASLDTARWPRLGVGCASLGSPAIGDDDAVAVLEHAWQKGIRLYDVAPLYGGGLGEERLGRMLLDKPRERYVLTTKTGVTRPRGQPATPPGSALPRSADRWDFSRAATRASIMCSCARLNVDRIDVVYLHDAEGHLDTAVDAFDELAVMRDEGVLGGIGIGSNLVAPVRDLLAVRRLDALLLAGRYTLLEQDGDALIHDAQREGIAVVVGGIYNSGVLAAWPQAHATFGYRPADRVVLERTARIAATCGRFGVPIGTAALQFVLRHPGVRTVLLGPRAVDELDASLAALGHDIPPALWEALAELTPPWRNA